MQQVVWFINKSHDDCWDYNLVGNDKKRQRFSSEGLLFPDMFSWKCLNISWSSYTKNILKPFEHDACFPFEHTETNLSIFSFK